METLGLYRDAKLVRHFVLRGGYTSVGQALWNDIVVHDQDVPEHAYLLHAEPGQLAVFERGRRQALRWIRKNEELALGGSHSLRWERDLKLCKDKWVEEPPTSSEGELFLMLGTGADARCIKIQNRPLTIGTESSCELVLLDESVCERHCRLEPLGSGVILRDLGSRSGTWLQGHRVRHALLYEGARVVLGRTELQLVRKPSQRKHALVMVAESAQMLEVIAEAKRFAKLSWPVLLTGESGVGKEEVAKLLHRKSERAKHAFVALNAGSLAPQLVEDEFFGHVRGAFTGAEAARRGVFEQAHQGTLFLDEIGELPLEFQVQLLRVLETWRVRRVGSEKEIPVDVRLICATHRDLPAMVERGEFRRDLYYRLNRLVLAIPPLRRRVEDIEALTQHFLNLMQSEIGLRTLDLEAMTRLKSHAWPGNARELKNVLSMAAASSDFSMIREPDIHRALYRSGSATLKRPSAFVQELVQQYGGNVSAAARSLGIPRTTLRDQLRRGRRSGTPAF